MLRTKCSHFSPFRCRSGFCSGTFDPEVVRTHYEKNGTAFGVSPPRGVQSQPFRMILPPPNVTGNLHIGHAITVAIEDAFVRHHKACGKNVTWYPGFDHAGIATQSVVEKKLFRETGKYRRDLSDEEFVRYCEAWKNDRIAEISMQLKQLGADLDWSKMFYTMDEKFSNVVSIAFSRLYDEGLIFREKRLVNWCPILESTISDQEVEIIDNQRICSRSGGTIVEMEKEQWFLRCDELYGQVLSALRRGEIKLNPTLVEGALVNWLKFDQPWCLSRQLLWGHSIPAYLDPESDSWIVAPTLAEARRRAKNGAILRRDSDVLDTWFSSSLIPLVVGGWPERTISTPTLDVLETGHDIIGFWVARMLALCKRLTGYFPFINVVLHGLVRDGSGRKMSKSLGNVVDPMDVINGISLERMLERLKHSNLAESEIESAAVDLRTRYPNGIDCFGADALRFAFFRYNVLALDVNLNVVEAAGEGYRFCNKLWNFTKYARKIFGVFEQRNAFHEASKPNIEDLWLRSRLASVRQNYYASMSAYDPHSAFVSLYNFIIGDLCDVYVETTKRALWTRDERRLRCVAGEMARTCHAIFTMLNTFMPFISGYLYDGLHKYIAAFEISSLKIDENYNVQNVHLEQEMQLALSIVSAVRSLSSEFNIPKNISIEGYLVANHLDVQRFSEKFAGVISSLCNFTFAINASENRSFYPYTIAGTSASIRVVFRNDDMAEKLADVLRKRLVAAEHRKAIFEKTRTNTLKLRAEKEALGSEKAGVKREIQKLTRTAEKAERIVHGMITEAEKIKNLLAIVETTAGNSVRNDLANAA